MDAKEGIPRGAGTRGRRGRGLSAHLGAIVAIPLALVVLLSGNLVLDQRARGAQANALAEQIRHLSVLSEFRFSLLGNAR